MSNGIEGLNRLTLHFQNLIAAISKHLKSHVNFLAQLWGDLKLARYRYGLTHRTIVLDRYLFSRQEIMNFDGIEPHKVHAPIPPHPQGDAVS